MIALMEHPAPDGRIGFEPRTEYHALIGTFIALGKSPVRDISDQHSLDQTRYNFIRVV